MRNTKQKLMLHFMLYPSKKEGWYTVACLEFGLIREGKDRLFLFNQINKLARRYAESAIKNNLSDDVLNQKLPKSYFMKYREIEKVHKDIKKAKETEDKQLREKWQKIFDSIVWKKDYRDTNTKVMIYG